MGGTDDFNARYRHYSLSIERMIIRLILILSLILVAGECLYQIEPIQKWLVETVRLEGIQTP